MVNTCVVPGCGSRSDRDHHLSFHLLPLKNKSLLKQWLHQIGRKNVPLNNNSRVCSKHFKQSHKCLLRCDEYPTENLPQLATRISTPTPRRPLVRRQLFIDKRTEDDGDDERKTQDVGINTDLPELEKIEHLEGRIVVLEREIKQLKENSSANQLSLESIASDDGKVSFYTGFPTYKHLKSCFDFLGPAAQHLIYRDSKRIFDHSNKGRPRCLPPMEEFFLTLVRLRLGLLEQDIAYRFGVSQSTVSRIFTSWINFLYLQFKQISLWPPREFVQAHMPKLFKAQYPTTRVIIDATELFIQQSSLPELQQRTFSSYKNHNTYKGLIGISPSGAVIFVSKLYPGSISDKELTRQSGLLDLLDRDDSIMADRGFDILEDLAPRGVRLNIPPFLRGKTQLDQREMTETRRIASLRIHVERCMERIKNYHIFDGVMPLNLMDVADQMFFVCAVLTNFHPPLVCA